MVYLCSSPDHAHTLVASSFASQFCSSDNKTEETEKDIEPKAETLRALLLATAPSPLTETWSYAESWEEDRNIL